jgi:hypothetical protein
MRKIEVVKPDENPSLSAYAAPRCRVSGTFECRRASPADASIWMLTADLESGATFDWEDRHGDEALFVQHGELEVDGRRCPEGGAVVIEADARPTLRTILPSRVVHMGPRDPAPPQDGLHGPASSRNPDVHVVGPRGIFESREEGRDTHFYADSTCPGCRLWLLYTSRSFAWETSVHSHSQDELVHLLQGEIRLGSLCIEPGSTVFIAAGQPYQLHSGEDGFAFINYRRDASEMTTRATGEKILEAGKATGLMPVCDPP